MIRTYLAIQTLALSVVLAMAFEQGPPRVRWSLLESIQVMPTAGTWT